MIANGWENNGSTFIAKTVFLNKIAKVPQTQNIFATWWCNYRWYLKFWQSDLKDFINWNIKDLQLGIDCFHSFAKRLFRFENEEEKTKNKTIVI